MKLELARSYGSVGELSQVTGDIPAALDNYGKTFSIFDSLSNGGVETERALSVLHVRYGRALRASGDLARALDNFRKGIIITNRLSAASPNDQRLKRDLAFASIFLGDALKDSGDLKEALAAQRTALALLAPLVTQTNAQSRRDVGVARQRIAEVLTKMGEERQALEIDLELLVVDEELARADLGVGYFRLGEMLENSHNMQETLVNYKKALTIKEAMSIADPSSTVARGDVSEDQMKASIKPIALFIESP